MSRACSLCNTPFPEGVKFCTECGGRTVEKSPGACSCGYVNIPNAKFCAECGKTMSAGLSSSKPAQSNTEFSIRPSAVKQGATQVSGLHGSEDVSQQRLVPEVSAAEREEALRKEEERMNKKMGTFSPPSNIQYGGLAGAYQNSPSSPRSIQTDPTPISPRSQPLFPPMKPQVEQQQRKKLEVIESIVEEIVVPLKNLSVKGSGTFCVYEVNGNSSADSDNPKMQVDDSSNSFFTFQPVPGRLNFSVECIVEGNDLIKFKLQTTMGGLLVKKYTLPFQFGCQNLKRHGNSIILDPF